MRTTASRPCCRSNSGNPGRERYLSAMAPLDLLQNFVDRHRRLFVLTGAGCSTNSGIPDYRDADGNWKRPQPVTYQAFMGDDATRRRYWARSMIGWRRFGRAVPNNAHRALARLEVMGRSEVILTQNVDRLHQTAGNDRVIDLHGRLDLVRCMGCGLKMMREEMQDRENIWEYLGRNKLAITVFDDQDDIVDKTCGAWSFFEQDPNRIAITTRRWQQSIIRAVGISYVWRCFVILKLTEPRPSKPLQIMRPIHHLALERHLACQPGQREVGLDAQERRAGELRACLVA